MSVSSQRQIQVLHVDDSPDITELTATFLQREDDRFTVETAPSADEGLQFIDERLPDCVVSDYNMPGMDGLEFLQAVREEYPDLPFILYTGKGSEAVASDAISAGVTDYLQKNSGSEQYELLANRVKNAVAIHRSQQVAQQRKERLELFFQESPLGFIQWDENIRVERLNEQAEEILGYDETELRGKSWEKIVAEDDCDRAGDTAAKLGAAEGGQHAVNRNIRKDGERRTIEWHNRTVTDADGTVQSVFSRFQDVTHREKRKTELEKRETIIESLTDAVYVLDEEGRFTYINNEFIALAGYDRERILGSKPSLIKDEEAAEQAKRQLGRLLSSDGPETATFEVTIEPCSGEPIVCEDRMGVLPYEGDHFNGSVGTLRDITDRKERDRELAQTRDLMANMEQLADVGAWEYDPKADTLIPTDGARRVHGLDSGADLSLEAAFDSFHPDDQDGLANQFNTCLETGEPYEIDVRLATLDGEQRWVTIRGERVEKRDGDVVRGYIRDITEQKEYEEELQAQNERLEEFASIISHDLRNPLGVAKGYIELAQDTGESDDFAKATNAIERSLSLIGDLLRLAREGETVGELKPVELADVAERSWETVATGAATLEIHTTQTLRADRSRLQGLLENLYRNAVEHGGDDVTVSVSGMDNGFYLADSGPGIPESDREEVFEVGYSTNEEGTGFGLRIVEQIADAHGWEVTATEGEQGGARFEFTGVERVEP